MRGLIERIISVDKNNSVMLTFTRLAETFLTCIIPSAVTMFVLSKKPVINLMYAMYFAGMFLCLCANGFFWFQFMKVLRDWGRFLKVNLGVYIVFAAVMLIGFWLTDDPQTYTTFFGIYRALEFFEVKTIVSLVAMNILSVGVMLLAGAAGVKLDFGKHRHGHSGRRHGSEHHHGGTHHHKGEEHSRSEGMK